MFTQEELEARKKYIGASEAAAALGLSRWGTPLRIWGEKLGHITPDEENLCMWVGTEMEEIVAKRFMLETGKKVHRVSEPFTHKKYDFLRCHIDRKVEGERAILQCKTVTAFKGGEWDDDKVPPEYIIQELHELACSGYERAYVACLIGNHRFVRIVLERNDKLINEVVRKLVEFWNNHVVTGIMPADIKPADNDTLYSLYPKQEVGKEIELNPDLDAKIELIKANQVDIKDLENKVDTLKAEIKAFMGEAESAMSDLYKVTWKAQSRNILDTEKLKAEMPEVYQKYASDSKTRVLRVSTNKKGAK